MGFIDDNLTSGEKVIYKAEISWLVYLMPFFYGLMALALYLYGLSIDMHTPNLMAYALVLLTIVMLVKAFIQREFTEIGVTNTRVIAKFGFIRRDTVEIPLSRVESVIVTQSIFERIINAGSVEVRGTGIGFTPVRFIDDPIKFRNALNEAIAQTKSSNS